MTEERKKALQDIRAHLSQIMDEYALLVYKSYHVELGHMIFCTESEEKAMLLEWDSLGETYDRISNEIDNLDELISQN